MDVALLFFDDCPGWELADRRLRAALADVGRGDVAVRHHRVSTPQEAEEVGFRGSPTVLVDGRDPFVEPGSPVGLSCRLYRTPDGLVGCPTPEQLVAVLR